MSSIEWTVIIGGLTAMAWINWYFFMAPAAAGKRERNNAKSRTSSQR
jgi:hypothetical protein